MGAETVSAGDSPEVTIKEGILFYVEHRTHEYAASTVQRDERRLQGLADYCDQRGIELVQELTPIELSRYRTWHRTEFSEDVDRLGDSTMADDMYRLKSFLRFLHTMEFIDSDLASSVEVPDNTRVRKRTLPSKRAKDILNYLEKFEYATRPHVEWMILANTAARPGDLRALDVGDDEPGESGDEEGIEFIHRDGTPLKKGQDSERPVSLEPGLMEIIEDYLEDKRHEVTDDRGRDPLLTTEYGRVSHSTLRRDFYRYSRPCAIGKECPHDRNPEDCEAANNADQFSQCPSSRSPYDVRKGRITHRRGKGVPPEWISERCDVSPEVLDTHYDFSEKDDRLPIQERIEEVIREVLEEEDYT